jgi:hypothetical protein
VKAVKPSAAVPPLEVTPTVPPTDALPSSSHLPTQGNIGVNAPHILPTGDNIGLSSQVENQCKVGIAVPTSVDLGDVGITDEVLHAAADLGTEKETTTTVLGDGGKFDKVLYITVPPTEALPTSSTLPTQGNIGVNLSHILPTGDNIGFSSQVHNQSEVGPGNTLPTCKEEKAAESLTATGPIPVDMGDVGTTDEVLYAAAELGIEDETTTTMLGDGTKVYYNASVFVVEHQSPTKVIGDGGITDKVLNATSDLGVEDKGAEETGTATVVGVGKNDKVLTTEMFGTGIKADCPVVESSVIVLSTLPTVVNVGVAIGGVVEQKSEVDSVA